MRFLETAKVSLIISVAILLGRLMGYVRELLIASQFGASSYADGILLLLNAPDLFNNMLSYSTISFALLPLLSTEPNEEERLLSRFVATLLFMAGLAYFLLLVVLLMTWREEVLFSISMGFAFLCVFPNSINAVLVSQLQFHRKFFLGALGTFVFNLVFIVFLILMPAYLELGIAVFLGALARLGLVIYDSRSSRLALPSVRTVWDARRQVPQTALRLLMPLCASGLVMIIPAVDKVFATLFREGTVAILSYGEKLYMLPLAIGLTPFSIALIPEIYRSQEENSNLKLSNLLTRTIPLLLGLSAGVVGVIYGFSSEIVYLVFGIADLSSGALLQVEIVLIAYSGALLVGAPLAVFTHLLFAVGRVKVAVLYCVTFLIFKLFWNYLVYSGWGVILPVSDSFVVSPAALLALGTSLISVLLFFGLYLFFILFEKYRKQQ